MRASLVFFALALTLLSPPLSQAQQTRAQMNAYNNNNIGANGNNAITGTTINTMNSAFINSFGATNDVNVWGKNNTFVGTTTFSGPIVLPATAYPSCAPVLATGTVCVNSSGFVVVEQ